MAYVIFIIIGILYLVINLFTAKCWSAKEMKHDFFDGQCLVGKFFANVFYIPAWFLKGIRFLVLALVK